MSEPRESTEPALRERKRPKGGFGSHPYRSPPPAFSHERLRRSSIRRSMVSTALAASASSIFT
ncbi:MAG: hypothetical protein WA424_09020, partial [Candidatus Sulfotelmatobacter sp.]